MISQCKKVRTLATGKSDFDVQPLLPDDPRIAQPLFQALLTKHYRQAVDIKIYCK